MESKDLIIEGQVAVWDLEITEKPKKVTEAEVKIAKVDIFTTENPTKIASKENEKAKKPLEITEMQQEFLNKNKILEDQNLSRLIKYYSGGVGIELVCEDNYKTIYVNTDGKKEFTIPNKVPVLPLDRILYYKISSIPPNNTQEEKMRELLEKVPFKRVVKRNGDENILVELGSGVISVTPIGWVLLFETINHVECMEDEVYLVSKEVTETNIGYRVKVGDYVQARYGKGLIEGEIVSEYGLGNEMLNIVFSEGTKHTAIGRKAVRKNIKSVSE